MASPAPPSLLERYRVVRRTTEELARPLSPEDMCAQSMPDASPTKWHLGHTTWFFETFLLAPHLKGYAGFDHRFGYIFNSYYEALGPRQPRPQRGLLTRPGAERVLEYRKHVNEGMGRLLAGAAGLEEQLRPLVELGLSHEQQHQELLLMDVLHLFAQSPIEPAYEPRLPAAARALPHAPRALKMEETRWVGFQGGLVEVGRDTTAGGGFAFDNEGPRHKVWLEPYELADRLVTNAEWLEFMEDGGYARPELWLSEGWARCREEGWERPMYWRHQGEGGGEGGWTEMTLAGRIPLVLDAPVSHVSFYEAEAFATWAGARLPTEFEWERAAATLGIAGGGGGDNLLDRGELAAAPAAEAAGGGGTGLRQMFGDLWEWTRSSYSPYPGYRPAAGAIGEYNGKFMAGQFVLRGGCCATPADHVRASYRNFFYPHQRWMFSGLRLARDFDFANDVLKGLALAPQKYIPPKHLYDAEGSRLFEEICGVEEYYPTRTEVALLREVVGEMAAAVPDGAALVEFGSGASVKTRLLLDAAPHVGVYAPIEISRAAVDEACESIRRDYPALTIAPVVGDYTSSAMRLPPAAKGRPPMGFFPGSTIGNFTRTEAHAFLENARLVLGPGSGLILGFDVVKPEGVLVPAYDDARGVTAAFNLNLLTRINSELGGDIDPSKFRHRAVWNAAESRIEMHLESLEEQQVTVAGRTFGFAEGETLHTENSHKFTEERMRAVAEGAGWGVERTWRSPEPKSWCLMLLRAPPAP